MALTATATTTLMASVIRTLCMCQVAIVAISPDTQNIRHAVAPFVSIEESFSPIVKKLAEKKVLMDRILIFCQTLDDCSTLYLFFKDCLGKNFLYPSDAPDLSKYRLVEMYTSCTETGVKNQIIASFNFQKLTPSSHNCYSCVWNGRGLLG